MDNAVYTWFLQVRTQNIPVSGELLLVKATQFAKMIDVCVSFKATADWLQNFRARCCKDCYREGSGDAPGRCYKLKKKEVKKVHEAYKPSNLFNGDETALFCELVPQGTLVVKGDQCKGENRSKVWLTVLFCFKESGTERLKFLIIGRSKNPRCFKNTKNLTTDYFSSKNAWMTSDLLGKWLLNWDNGL